MRAFAACSPTLAASSRRFLDRSSTSFGAEVVLVMGRIAGAFDLFGPGLSKGLSVPALLGERPDEAALLGAAELLLNPA